MHSFGIINWEGKSTRTTGQLDRFTWKIAVKMVCVLFVLHTVLSFRQITSIFPFYQFIGTVFLQLFVELEHDGHLNTR